MPIPKSESAEQEPENLKSIDPDAKSKGQTATTSPQENSKLKHPQIKWVRVEQKTQDINWAEKIEVNEITGPYKHLAYEVPIRSDSLRAIYMVLVDAKSIDPSLLNKQITREELAEWGKTIYELLIDLNPASLIRPALECELRPINSNYAQPSSGSPGLKNLPEDPFDPPERRLRSSIQWLHKADLDQQNLSEILDIAIRTTKPEYAKITKRKVLEAYEAYKKIGDPYSVITVIPPEMCPEIK